MRSAVLLAVLMSTPSWATDTVTMLDTGLTFTGATPFLKEGGGILSLGAAQVSEGNYMEARLNLVPAFTIDWGMGGILKSGEKFPISAALSGSKRDKAWFPMADALMFLSPMGKPGVVAQFAFNTVPKERHDEPEDYLAVPVAVGVGLPLGGEGFVFAPSVVAGWSLSKFTGWYTSVRLVARTTHVVGGYVRTELMMQQVRGPNAYLYTGTLIEFGVSFRLGEG
ncbi:MAG: hypothetical protein KC912_17515 [Proteobacteria bacterium]|nr:hypothetical protein [Pseudomonadota bacterium]